MISDPFIEWQRCARLRQVDIDRLTSAGVPILGLAGNLDGSGFALARDRIVPDAAARRFELQRYDETAGESVCALIVLALGRNGSPLDLVAISGTFAGSWLGRVGLLGEENLDRARDVLTVHPTPLDWLRAERDGVCIVDPVRAASVLRDAGTMEVGTHAERRRLLDMMAVRLPHVRVRGDDRRAAA